MKLKWRGQWQNCQYMQLLSRRQCDSVYISHCGWDLVVHKRSTSSAKSLEGNTCFILPHTTPSSIVWFKIAQLFHEIAASEHSTAIFFPESLLLFIVCGFQVTTRYAAHSYRVFWKDTTAAFTSSTIGPYFLSVQSFRMDFISLLDFPLTSIQWLGCTLSNISPNWGENGKDFKTTVASIPRENEMHQFVSLNFSQMIAM